MYRNECWSFLNYAIYHALIALTSVLQSAALTLEHVRSHFIAPVVRLDRKCWLWGPEFRSEHLPEGGKLWPPEWAACDLSPQLCDFKSHASVGKHTCWKACWECGLAMSTHIGRIKSHLPNQIHFEECLVIWGQCGFVKFELGPTCHITSIQHCGSIQNYSHRYTVQSYTIMIKKDKRWQAHDSFEMKKMPQRSSKEMPFFSEKLRVWEPLCMGRFGSQAVKNTHIVTL